MFFLPPLLFDPRRQLRRRAAHAFRHPLPYTYSSRAEHGEAAMIDHLDHLVLTTADEAACIDFYTRVLGMRLENFTGGTPPLARKALKFGRQKINLHLKGREFEPKAAVPMPGSLDLCFIAGVPLDEVMANLAAAGWPIELGPVLRTGAIARIRSVYVRDPDRNLVEISEIVPAEA
jgi:catechol 2,3-dioxygenase-like lactoylglutathione lyase family enzyme